MRIRMLGAAMAAAAMMPGSLLAQGGAEDPFAADRDASAPTSGVSYEAIDRATVRIFAAQGVDAEQVNGAHFARTIALPAAGHGTGVAVSSNLIITAQHVVADAHHIAVRVPGEDAPRPAVVAYEDEERDFALVVVAAPLRSVIPLPETVPSLRIRQTVDAVGYPLDASRRDPQSSRGIVSGVLDDGQLQLSMSLNPGNSGGPLVDENGALVGIVMARGDPTRGVLGIGYAVPMAPILAAVRASEGPIAQARQALQRDLGSLQQATDVLDMLVQLGGGDVLRDLLAVVEQQGGDRTLEKLRRHGAVTTDPDIQLLIAALYWDAAELAMERAGSFRLPHQLPLGPARDSAIWFRERAVELVHSAVEKKPGLTETSSFAAHVMGVSAPSGSWSRALGGGLNLVPEDDGPSWRPDTPFWRVELALAAGADQPPGVGGFHVAGDAAWPVLSNGERSTTRVALLLGASLTLGYWDERPLVHFAPEVGLAVRIGARGPGVHIEFDYVPGLFLSGGDLAFAHAAYRVRLGFAWWRTITGITWLGVGRKNDYAYHSLGIFCGRHF